MSHPPLRVLIVKTSALGDIIQSFPVLGYLHKHFPSITIDWVVEKSCAELVQSHPLVHQAFCIETKRWLRSCFSKKIRSEIRAFRDQLQKTHYDVVFDLQGNIKSGIVVSQVLSKAKVGFGCRSVSEWPNCLFTKTRYNPPLGR